MFRTPVLHSIVSRRYISPSHHVWLIPTPEKLASPISKCKEQPPHTYRVEIGLTNHSIQELGDVVSIRPALSSSKLSQPLPNLGESIEKDKPMLLLDWEGYAITSADELYHTVWENAEGTQQICSPLSGVLKEIMDVDPTRGGIDESDVVAVVTSSREDIENAADQWVNEEEYEQILKAESVTGMNSQRESEKIFFPPESGWSG